LRCLRENGTSSSFLRWPFSGACVGCAACVVSCWKPALKVMYNLHVCASAPSAAKAIGAHSTTAANDRSHKAVGL